MASASSPSSGPPDAYRIADLRRSLLLLATPPVDGKITLHINGTTTGIAVSGVRCTEEGVGLLPPFPLDSAYQAAVTSILARVVTKLDTLAEQAAHWRATTRDTWTAKVIIVVKGGLPFDVQADYGLPGPPPPPVRASAAAAPAAEPEAAARLRRRGYTLPDPAGVARLLARTPALAWTLRALPAALAPHFPSLPPGRLILLAEGERLVVLVADSAPDAEARLVAFDAAWRALDLAGSEGLLIDLAPTEADAA